MRSASSWSIAELWVVGVVIVVAAAVAASQLNDDRSIGSMLTYAGFVLGMVGLVLGTAALFRGAAPGQGDARTSTAQRVMLAGGVIVVAWAAASTARMDGGFVLAAFVAQVAIGLVYVIVAGFAAMAVTRARSR